MQSGGYFARVNPDLLSLIPVNASRIVEIGCGAGALAQAYRQFNPICHYTGVEINPEQAERARSCVDHLITGNIEHLLADRKLPIPSESIDCLIFGDVLEHLIDPWATLKACVQWLKPTGVLCACIPNVQHWSIFTRLLEGKWNYTDQGLLDRTHLRFFTRSTILEMMEQAGLHCWDIEPRQAASGQSGEFVQELANLAKRFGIKHDRLIEGAGTIQYVVKASRTKPVSPIHVQTILTTQSICHHVRVLAPDRFMNTLGGVSATSGQSVAPIRDPHVTSKILVLQRRRSSYPGDVPFFQRLYREGYIVVSETDDDPLHFPWHEQNRFFTYRACHAIKTSTQPLGDFFKTMHQHVGVFPNQLTSLPATNRPTAANGDRVRIFFGALNRAADYAPIMAELNRVLEQRSANVQVVVVHDEAFAKQVNVDHKEFHPFCEYDRYLELLGTCDIALLPLADTPFNHKKSDLKFLECASRRVAVLASPTVYAKTIVPNQTGLIFENADDFGQKLTQLIESQTMRQSLADAAFEYVRQERMLAYSAAKQLDWYRWLIDNRSQLEADLRARCPEAFGLV